MTLQPVVRSHSLISQLSPLQVGIYIDSSGLFEGRQLDQLSGHPAMSNCGELLRGLPTVGDILPRVVASSSW